MCNDSQTPKIKANQNRNVDSIKQTIFNLSLGSMALHGVYNPKTSTVSIFKDRGSPEHQMTNRCLLFTQCAITVKIFSAQNVMNYLLDFFFKHPIMAACNFPVSIYRVSRLPFQCCVIRQPASSSCHFVDLSVPAVRRCYCIHCS